MFFKGINTWYQGGHGIEADKKEKKKRKIWKNQWTERPQLIKQLLKWEDWKKLVGIIAMGQNRILEFGMWYSYRM